MIKVLIVDDSALVRNVLAQGLAQDPGLEIVGTARDPFDARDKIMQLVPDVLTLDVEMPRMDGLEFLRRLMPQRPMPVVMVSALTQKGKAITLEALEAGAVDFVTKPAVGVAEGLNQMLNELAGKIKIAAGVDVSHLRRQVAGPPPARGTVSSALAETTDKIIAIGASTGGTEAIKAVITQFPRNTPGVVIVQHMPPGFTAMFAKRLDNACEMEVKEAAHGDRVINGRILIAPGDYHMQIVRSGGIYKVELTQQGLINGHRPAVEVLFNSVAQCAGTNAVGIILTGMGADGADGLVKMRKAGARTIAQDEATSVVFGMPKEAYVRGGAEKLMPLNSIAAYALKLLEGKA